MLHDGPRVAGLLAIVAALLLAPSAHAASAGKKAPAATKAEQRAYGKHCETKRKGRAAERTKCLKAMARLATGRSSSPTKACAALSRKKHKRERTSPYARCVAEGAKLLKDKRRADAERAAAAEDERLAALDGHECEPPEPIDDSPGIDEPDASDPLAGDDEPEDDDPEAADGEQL